jgi:hypothetical protein
MSTSVHAKRFCFTLAHAAFILTNTISKRATKNIFHQ